MNSRPRKRSTSAPTTRMRQQAAVEDAKARMRDAELDLEYCHVRGALHRAHRRAPGVARKPDRGQPRRDQPDHAADDAGFARSALSRLRHERIRFPDLLARARRIGGPLANKVLIGLQRREQFQPRGHARLHRQCARPLQRHHSRARHGAEPGSVPGARPVRAAARRDRAAHAGLSAAGRRRRARPVAAPGDDGGAGWHREAEDRRPPASCAAGCG